MGGTIEASESRETNLTLPANRDTISESLSDDHIDPVLKH